MDGLRTTRRQSSLAYAGAMLVVAVYFALLSGLPLYPAMGAAMLSVLSAAVLGHALGGWYAPVDRERPTFELVAVPALVLMGAPVIAAVLFLLAGAALYGLEPRPALIEVVPGGIAAAVLVLSATWPVALTAFSAAGIAMARIARRGNRPA